MEPGSVCASVAEIDRAPTHHTEQKAGLDPVIDGAIPARLYSQGAWTAGAIAGAPLREPDPVVKIAIAPWIDAEGDYHAGSEVYGVMRRGSWYVVPKPVVQHVDLSRLARNTGAAAAPAQSADSAPPAGEAASAQTSKHEAPAAAPAPPVASASPALKP